MTIQTSLSMDGHKYHTKENGEKTNPCFTPTRRLYSGSHSKRLVSPFFTKLQKVFIWIVNAREHLD